MASQKLSPCEIHVCVLLIIKSGGANEPCDLLVKIRCAIYFPRTIDATPEDVCVFIGVNYIIF